MSEGEYKGTLAPHRAEIEQMINDGVSCSAIGKKFGVSSGAVVWAASRWGLKTVGDAEITAAYMKRREQIVELHVAGVAGRDIAKRLGISKSWVSTVISKYYKNRKRFQRLAALSRAYQAGLRAAQK